jgi:Flp pilus assembly protein TadG
MRKRFASLLRNLIFGEGGGALVEVAIFMGILAPPMVFGTCEVASLAYASIEVANAAHAGAAYAAQNYNTKTVLPTQAQVTTAVQNDVPDVATFLKSGTSLTATMATGCTGGAATVGNTVPTYCAGAQPYVQVTVNAIVVPRIQLPGLFGSHASQMTMNTSAAIPLVN